MLTRRRLLGGAAAISAGCAARRVNVAPASAANASAANASAANASAANARTGQQPARVEVARDRVIRTIVGLRPFRPSGFVVRTEKLDSKTLVHNYGHGGAGITLSWGTAQLAVEEAAPLGARECAVLGCGVVGLSTARLMQMRGASVTIYAKAMPPETTSNVAGGLWEPVSLFDHAQVTPRFRLQFAAAARTAWRRYQSLAGDPYGVRWLPLYTLSSEAAYTPPPPESPNFEVDALYPEPRVLTREENPFDVAHAYGAGLC